MSILSFIISIALMAPFFWWGIHTLRVRYQFHEELKPVVEFATLGGVVLFFFLEMSLLRGWMANMPVLYIFTALALIVSAAALYGPMLVSVASQIVVDIVHPPSKHDVSVPQFSSAEALEEHGDYEGALAEYLVLARIFPRDADTALRVADMLMELNRAEQAVRHFERGLELLSEVDRAIRVTMRLSEIYQRRLYRSSDAQRVLESFLERFPHSERTNSVQIKIKRISEADDSPARRKNLDLEEMPPPGPLG